MNASRPMPVLFTIETPAVRLTWSQRRLKPVPVEQEAQGPPFGLRLEAGPDAGVYVAEDVPAHLFEQTNYTLFVESTAAYPIAVQHRDPVLIQGLHRSDDGRVVHGMINFGTQVGHSRFVIEVAGRSALGFAVEIFPSKLDYRYDYAALRDDVRDIAAELIFEHLRATYDPAALDPPHTPGTLAWLALLRHVTGDLEQALRYVNLHPQWGTARAVEVQRADRLRHPDAVLRRAIRQGTGSGSVLVLPGPVRLREHLPAHTHRYTLDTPAHRWLADCLRRIRHRLALLRGEEVRHRPGTRRQHVLGELAALQRRIVHLQRLPIVQEAGNAPPAEPPQALLTAPGYREAYQACLHLHQGLRLDGGPLDLNLKDLHLLFEYWCYLTLVRLAADLTGQRAPLRSLVAVERQGLRLRLRKGHAHTARFPLPDGRLDVTYNPRFGGRGLLVPQQPDLLLTRHHRDGARTRYILDAKYRLDASPGYRRRYGVPGPPPDALNILHRYRDALRTAHAPVAQAIALYPYRDDPAGAYEQSRLHRLLREIGVGAIPLLPGATHHVATWLRTVLTANS